MRFLTGRHLKAARALAGLSQRQLAAAAGLHFNSVKYHEEKSGPLNGYAVDKMAEVLSRQGVATSTDGALFKKVA
jgi:transcriptional regulator with XRE-family HTH domain